MTSDPAEYRYELPKVVSAGAIILDEAGRLCVVNPTYKDAWEIPGGLSEAGESPRSACIRELGEELGLQREVGRLLALEWRPGRRGYPDGLHLLFDGGSVTPAEVEAFRLPPDELSEFVFLPSLEAVARLPERMRDRILAAVEVRRTDGPIAYLEAGEADPLPDA